jgi:putative two-component system response regulator
MTSSQSLSFGNLMKKGGADYPGYESWLAENDKSPIIPVGIDSASTIHNVRFDADANAQMERMVTDFGQMYRERNEALKEVARAHHDALFRLALAADFKDDDTGVHIVRIGFLAEALALALGHKLAWAELLRKAAPMHDIGKIGIPDAVLKKKGAFIAEERATMNQHAQMGADILGQSRIPLFQLAAEVALTHHERFDGRGYPNGLEGANIPMSGRIVSVVDFFDALTMDRCYRPAMADDTVHKMLLAEREKAFDPHIVDTFLAQWPRFLALRDSVTRLQPSFADLVRGSIDGVESSSWERVLTVDDHSQSGPHDAGV